VLCIGLSEYYCFDINWLELKIKNYKKGPNHDGPALNI